MVVVLHVLKLGGVLRSVSMRTANYYTAWMFEIICYCAVNCYALITGYFHYDRKYSLQSLLMICVQTLFYSVSIYGLFWIVMPDRISFGALLNAFFPVFRETHWYVSSYAGLFLLIPLLNVGITAFSREVSKYYLVVSAIAFSIIPTVWMMDPFKLNAGYSTVWLMHLYTIGALIKKYNWDTKVSRKRSLQIFALSVVITMVYKFSVEEITTLVFGESKFSELMLSYTSPTIIFAGVSLFLYFLTFQPSERSVKYLRMLSPAAFGVYLIHCHPYIYDLLADRFVFLSEWNPLLMPLGIIGCSLGIYVPCLLIDYIRLKLFEKLGCKKHFAKLSDRLLPERIRETI